MPQMSVQGNRGAGEVRQMRRGWAGETKVFLSILRGVSLWSETCCL